MKLIKCTYILIMLGFHFKRSFNYYQIGYKLEYSGVVSRNVMFSSRTQKNQDQDCLVAYSSILCMARLIG